MLIFISHSTGFDKNLNLQFDYGYFSKKDIPDPYVSENFKFGSTGICRNSNSLSPQSKVYEFIKNPSIGDIYLIYYSGNLVTGILKVNKNKSFENHYEGEKKLNFDLPNLGDKIGEKKEEYKKRTKYPYITGQWLNFKKYNGLILTENIKKYYKIGYNNGSTISECRNTGIIRKRFKIESFIKFLLLENKK